MADALTGAMEAALEPDLVAQAAETFALAEARCGTCRDYHAVRPYLLAAGIVRGLDRDASRVEAWLREITAPSARVLIAGSGDASLLGHVSRMLDGRSAALTIIDRCPTPLELCRRLAVRHALEITLRAEDLACLPDTAVFDVVIAHRLLGFLDAEVEFLALVALRRALCPNGRMLLVVNAVTGRPDVALIEGAVNRTAERVLRALHERQIALPEPLENFTARLNRYGLGVSRRAARLQTPAEISALMADAGLVIETRDRFSTREHSLSGIRLVDELLIARAGP